MLDSGMGKINEFFIKVARLKILRALVLLVAALFAAACSKSEKTETHASYPTQDIARIYIKMVLINGAKVTSAPTGQNVYGVFAACTSAGPSVTITVSDFRIAESETPYSVWYGVRKWAENNGYTFANPGKEGSAGIEGAKPLWGVEDDSEPVTNINWRDAVVWCNAYSEAMRKTAVYYDADEKEILRDSTDAKTVDGATMKRGATGYRLPTEVQWEYAARGGDPRGQQWNDIFAGTNDSGTASGGLGDYAWYHANSQGVTHTVKTKKPNAARLYDMSGNVMEWCFDWYGGVPNDSGADFFGAELGTIRIMRGGSWFYEAEGCEVSSRTGNFPYSKGNNVGFRIVCP